MNISFASLNASERYHVMTQVIIPRPIAWVLSDNGHQDASDPHAFNLAPFSYFNAVSSDPALIMISAGSKPDGSLKDTRRNIVERKQCVIHIPSEDHAQALTESAATLEHGQSEIEKLGLRLVQQEGWRLPRLDIALIAMACRLYDYQEIGPHKQGLIFCEIEDVYIHDSCVSEAPTGRTKIEAEKIAPLARLGSSEYATFGSILKLERPS